MKDSISAVYDLGKDILAGKLSQEDTMRKIKRIENEFGTDAFQPYPVKKKEKPWDASYLAELDAQRRAGACSREFFLHLQEVKEEVDRKAKKAKTTLCACVAGCVLAIAIIAMLVALLRK